MMTAKRSDTAEKILKISAQLFADKGYDAVSLRDIANACGIKAPSLYNHFKDKQTLYRSVLQSVFAKQAPQFLSCFQSEESPEQQLKNFIHSACFAIAEEAIFRHLFQRELLSADDQHLQFLAEEVMAETCQEIHDVLLKIEPTCDSHFMTTSLVGLMFFQFQMNKMRPFMAGSEPKHSNTAYITAQIEKLIFNQIRAV
jgi:AcrR family transcriptional regulator